MFFSLTRTLLASNIKRKLIKLQLFMNWKLQCGIYIQNHCYYKKIIHMSHVNREAQNVLDCNSKYLVTKHIQIDSKLKSVNFYAPSKPLMAFSGAKTSLAYTDLLCLSHYRHCICSACFAMYFMTHRCFVIAVFGSFEIIIESLNFSPTQT